MSFKVDTNIPEVSSWLKKVHKDQLPFATSQAINTTAFEIRKQLVDKTYPGAFDLKNKRFPSVATNVNKSKKTKLEAVIGNWKGQAFDYLPKHAEGGTKKPRGRHIAVPSRELRADYPTKKIPKSQKPKAILKKKGGFTFVTSKKKLTVIAYRKPKRGKKGKSGDIEIKYILIKRAQIDKELPFYEDALKVAEKRYPKNWAKAFEFAIRTAK